MDPSSARELLDDLQRSGLIRPEQVEPLTAALAADPPSTKPTAARILIEQKALTPYQAEQWLAGNAVACVVAGRYRILEKLGEGGMGAVYRAHDTRLDRDIALKILPARSLGDADAIARFGREARALAKLAHPNIIQAYDNGEDKGRHFLVMEYVEGASLSAILREQGAIAPTLAADFIHQAALGLQHAHEKGLIHRDLKPANLLVARGRTLPHAPVSLGATKEYVPPPLATGVLKILDLGLARFLQDHVGDGQLTQEGMGVGTPDYMAPEQFRDALHADARTDIYGLGCTLYQLIAGTVPFPGSSFSEKAQSHAKKEPIPLEERSPEVPAGLAFVVSKMMAKHPADRFQTAAEVAEALAPYVAGASHSMIMLRQTMRFHAGQLTMKAPSRGKRLMAWSGAAAAAILFGSLLYFAWPTLFPERSPDLAYQPPDTKQIDTKPAEPEKPKVVTIENGLTVAKDGTGQYETIGEAIKDVKPGQVVRVLDKAVYREAVSFKRTQQHRGIALESPLGATLEFPPKTEIGIVLVDVSGVRITGFRLRGDMLAAVVVYGKSAGTILERLDVDMKRESSEYGVSIEGATAADQEPPIVVRDCRIRNAGNVGLRISGFEDYQTPRLCRRVMLLDNRVEGCGSGVHASGQIQQIFVAGNQLWDCEFAGMQLENVMAGSESISFFNNTTLHCGSGLRLWDGAVRGKNIQVRGNLFLKSVNADFVYIDSGGDPEKFRGPGNPQELLKVWSLSHNWRETVKPTGGSIDDRSWVPPVAEDVAKDEITGIAVNPAQSDFLRPGRESELATKGAGGDLPAYIGAVAPEGGKQWNWQWTWDAQVNQLITVSKNPEDGGRFQKLEEAVRAVGQGMTIRIVDGSSYAEAVSFSNPTRHLGVTLESTGNAVIELPNRANSAVEINGVEGVRIRNLAFRVAADRENRVASFIEVSGAAAGTRIEKLDMESSQSMANHILLRSVRIPLDKPPVTVTRCRMVGGKDGVAVFGPAELAEPNQSGCRAMVVDNRFEQTLRGVIVEVFKGRVIVAGNLFLHCVQAGAQATDLPKGAGTLHLLNNTFFKGAAGFRNWDTFPDDEPDANQVELLGNLALECNHGDFLAFRSSGGSITPGDGGLLVKHWKFRFNCRDMNGSEKPCIIPLAADDHKLSATDLVSQGAKDPDFLRPKADSPIARDGAGNDDTTLPKYVGAVPPKGVEPWDWERTWKERRKKSP